VIYFLTMGLWPYRLHFYLKMLKHGYKIRCWTDYIYVIWYSILTVIMKINHKHPSIFLNLWFIFIITINLITVTLNIEFILIIQYIIFRNIYHKLVSNKARSPGTLLRQRLFWCINLNFIYLFYIINIT
jgi:hypothetical protein